MASETKHRSRPPIAAILTGPDLKEIIDRRKDKAAARTLAKEFKIGENRVYKIWQDAGIRFDKDAIPIYPESVKNLGATEAKGLRGSKGKKFQAKEPPEPVEADETVGGDETASEAIDPDNIADETEDKVRAELGTLGAGNDSDEVLEDVEDKLDKLRIRGKISPGQYKKLIREAESTHEANSESEATDAELSEAPSEPVRRAPPRQIRPSGAPSRAVRDGRHHRPRAHGAAQPLQAHAAHARPREPAAERRARADAGAPRSRLRPPREPSPSEDGDGTGEESDGSSLPALNVALSRPL